jgi:hypothetical protein
MDTIGLDLHKRESQLCIIGPGGEITEKRIVTTRERFTTMLGVRAPCRILLEASTESEWVARHRPLEWRAQKWRHSHELSMIGTSPRKR